MKNRVCNLPFNAGLMRFHFRLRQESMVKHTQKSLLQHPVTLDHSKGTVSVLTDYIPYHSVSVLTDYFLKNRGLITVLTVQWPNPTDETNPDAMEKMRLGYFTEVSSRIRLGSSP